MTAALVCSLPSSLRKPDAFESFSRLAGRRAYRVLLVDDGADPSRLLAQSPSNLAERCFRVDRVDTLEAAMARLESDAYDAVVLDLADAVAHGETATADTGSVAAERWPVVVLTGKNAPELVMAAARLGVHEYCVKGEFHHRELPALVTRAIAVRRGASPKPEGGEGVAGAHDGARNPADSPAPGVGQGAFCDRLRQALARRRRREDRFAVVRLELDHLDMLRDLGGADLHEEVLESAATRLAARLREGDTLAHLDGSGFAAILEDLTSPIQARGRARQLAESLLGVHMQKDSDVELTGLTASIGIACHPDDGADIETLVAKAEAAMAWSATRGGHRIRLFSDDAA